MSARPFNTQATTYTWDAGKPTAHKGIAITTRSSGYPRAFIATREDAMKLATQLVNLIDNPNTFN